MKLTIEIDTQNAAFEEAGSGTECASILTRLLERQGFDGRDLLPGEGGNLRDSNGNTVGRWEVSE